MTTRQQKGQMLDYLVAKLSHDGSAVEPSKREFVSGIDSSYIRVNDGLVFLVDQTYTGEKFERIRSKVSDQFPGKVAFVFFKDGETFFRSAARSLHYKSRRELSLKDYDSEQINRTIIVRPEERVLLSRGRKWLQYYQPNSSKLEEGIRCFRFEPLNYDYSHIEPERRFGPKNKSSSMRYIWTEEIFMDIPLTLEGNLLNRNFMISERFLSQFSRISVDLEDDTDFKVQALRSVFGYDGLRNFGLFGCMDRSPESRRAIGHVFLRKVEEAQKVVIDSEGALRQ